MKNLNGLIRVSGLTQFSLSKRARVSRAKIADVATRRGMFTTAESRRVLVVLADCISKSLAEVNASLQAVEGEAEEAAAVLGS